MHAHFQDNNFKKYEWKTKNNMRFSEKIVPQYAQQQQQQKRQQKTATTTTKIKGLRVYT